MKSRGLVPALVVALVTSNAAWWWWAQGGSQDSARARPPIMPPRDETATAAAEEGAAGSTVATDSTKTEAFRDLPAEQRTDVAVQQDRWVRAVLQLQEPARAAEALAEIRQALEGGDTERRIAALLALRALAGATFDREPFRRGVLQCLADSRAAVRAYALQALATMGPRAGDVALVATMARDPDATVRASLGPTLAALGDRVISDQSSDVIKQLLHDKEEAVVAATMRGLRQVAADASLQDQLVLLAREERMRATVFEAVLPFLRAKSEAVVNELLAGLGDSDPHIRDLALQGLAAGIPEHLKDKVLDAYLRVFVGRRDEREQSRCLAVLARQGGTREVRELEGWLEANPLSPMRTPTEQAIAQMHKRLGGR